VTGDAFHFQSAEECRARNSAKIPRQVFEHILVSSETRCALIALQEGQAGSAAETLFEIIHVGLARFGLLREACQLDFQYCGLEFGDAVVEANQAVAELVGDAGAAAIHIGLGALVEFEIAGNNGAALSGSDQFAGLKAEAPEIAGGTCAFVAPFAAVGVGAILDDPQVSSIAPPPPAANGATQAPVPPALPGA